MKSLSIIIPVYNNEKDLDKCLTSILNQNIDDLEIVVVNDGSTDNSEKVIKKYQEKYDNIFKYYFKENTGVADTRNYGLDKAEGKYIMFVDADDYLDTSLYKNVKKYMDVDTDLIKYKLQINTRCKF